MPVNNVNGDRGTAVDACVRPVEAVATLLEMKVG
jgi:hypothetical protein